MMFYINRSEMLETVMSKTNTGIFNIVETTFDSLLKADFLESLNKHLSKTHIVNVRMTKNFITDTYREFVTEFEFNSNNVISHENIKSLTKEARRLLSEFKSLNNTHILEELDAIDKLSKDIRPLSDDSENMFVSCRTIIAKDNSDIGVAVNAQLSSQNKKNKSRGLATKLIAGVLEFILLAVIELPIEQEIRDAYNKYRFDVTSYITEAPQYTTVIDDYVSVYKEANSHSEKVGRLLYDDSVEIVDSSEHWYKIEYLNPINEITVGYIPNRSVDYYIQ